MKNALLLALCCASVSLPADWPSPLGERPARKIEIGKTPVLTLTADNVQIVGDADQPYTKEMARVLSKVFGKNIPVAAGPSEGKISLVLGIGKASAAVKIDDSTLCRDAFIIRTVGKNVYILGRDEKFTGADGERGTLFGVYDFLERFAGVRFYFPGELGEIIPVRKELNIPEINLYDRPDYTARNLYFSGGVHMDSRNQLRLETEKIPNNHGLARLGYIERFGKAHPEYFAMQSSGQRFNDPGVGHHPGHLCFQSGIREEIYQDAKAFLSGKTAKERGVYLERHKDFRWDRSAFRPGYFNIMPQDGLQMCQCPACKAKFGNDTALMNEYIWEMIAEIANRLRKENIPGKITTMSYGYHNQVPKADIPDNVMVMVALRGPWSTPVREAADLRRVDDWNRKINQKVWLWTYTCKSGKLLIPGIPFSTPRAFGEYYGKLKDRVFGVFTQVGGVPEEWLTGFLNYYVFSRVMWDNNADTETLLKEHFDLMYGKAAHEMRKIFDTFEKIWIEKITANTVETNIGPVTTPPSDQEIWSSIYSEEVMASLEKGFEKAISLANPVERKRIELMRETFLVPLQEGRALYLSRGDGLKCLGMYSDIPFVLPPFRPKPDKKSLITKVTVSKTASELVVSFDCEEPSPGKMAASECPPDNPNLFKENCVEIFLNPNGDRKEYYQIVINSRGSLADQKMKRVGRSIVSDWKWNSEAKVEIKILKDRWTVRASIPLSKFPDMRDVFPANFGRERAVVGSDGFNPLYQQAILGQGFADVSQYASLDFSGTKPAPNLITNGTFTAKNNRNNYGGWNFPKKAEEGTSAALDRNIFAADGVSLCLSSTGNPVHVQQSLPLKPGGKYVLSCFLRFEDVQPLKPGGGVSLNIMAGQNHWFPDRRPFTGSEEWIYREFEFTVPADFRKKATYLRLSLRNASGKVWFDDVRLTERN